MDNRSIGLKGNPAYSLITVFGSQAMIKNIVFDFDSTIINAEGTELVIREALQREKPEQREKKMERLKAITHQATNGDMPLGEALQKRFNLTRVTREDVENAAAHILNTINPRVRETIRIFQERGKQIFIFSNSFIELLKPVASEVGVPSQNLFANDLVYQDGQVTGFNEDNPLFLSLGKVFLAEQLRNEGRLEGGTAVVGDGYSDLVIRRNNVADMFVYFAGTALHEPIRKQADFSVDRFDQLLPLFFSDNELSNDSAEVFAAADNGHKGEAVPAILLLENIHIEAQNKLQAAGYHVERREASLGEEAIYQSASEANIIGIRSKTHLTKEIISRLPDLWAIAAFSIGTNQIDLQSAAHSGIPVFNAPFSNTRSVAELVVGEIIMLMRRIFEKNTAAHRGQWLKTVEGASEIRGKTVGIIGYGHIGSQVSVLLEGLGMTVIFYDIVDKLPLGNAQRANDLYDLLKHADIVTLHVPDTSLTRGMIGDREIRALRRGSFLINASRGKVVDLDALRRALLDGHIAGAAIDVFPQEPAKPTDFFETPLQNIPNVILTPHIGGSTREAQENIARYVADKIHAFISTGNTIGSVNFPEVDMPRVKGTDRILHIHENVPGVLAKINSVFARRHINVESQILKTKDDIGYLIVDVNHRISEQVFNLMSHITETIKVRRITAGSN